MKKAILIMGNPVDGFIFYGPFEDEEGAIEYAKKNSGYDWWVGYINPSTR